MAGFHCIVCDQGATLEVSLTYLDSDGAAVNLSGYTARMQVRTEVTAAAATLTLTTENGRIALGGAAGTVALTVPAIDTAAVAAGEYVYDLELVTGARVVRLIEGSFVVRAEVTR